MRLGAGRNPPPDRALGDNPQRPKNWRWLWPLIAAAFALVAVLLMGVIIGSRNNSPGGAQAGPTGATVRAAPTTTTPPASITATPGPNSDGGPDLGNGNAITTTRAPFSDGGPDLGNGNAGSAVSTDQSFLSALDAQGIHYVGLTDKIVQLGRLVCSELSRGSAASGMVNSIAGSGHWNIGESTAIVGIAVAVYCPSKKSLVYSN